MKIEMCENLFYSFLRHVKECQIVQTNWKVSKQWTLRNEAEISNLYKLIDDHFFTKYQHKIFKQNSSYRQFIFQGEVDAVGVSFENGEKTVFAVDVAFHEFGLNYGSRAETVRRIIAKCARTAMCLYGYMDTISGEIIFASPKIGLSILNDLTPCIDDLNLILQKHNLNFQVRVIANEDFNNSVLQPILLVSDGIADTSELFIRGYQMYSMFAPTIRKRHTRAVVAKRPAIVNSDIYRELKIGQLAQKVLKPMLEAGIATVEEIELMQTAEYSKSTFDLGYPLLVSINSDFDPVRYYSQPLWIRGKEYKMCSQWFEVPANNDRPYLLKWIEEQRKA